LIGVPQEFAQYKDGLRQISVFNRSFPPHPAKEFLPLHHLPGAFEKQHERVKHLGGYRQWLRSPEKRARPDIDQEVGESVLQHDRLSVFTHLRLV
jgi:hypothetical protein